MVAATRNPPKLSMQSHHFTDSHTCRHTSATATVEPSIAWKEATLTTLTVEPSVAWKEATLTSLTVEPSIVWKDATFTAGSSFAAIGFVPNPRSSQPEWLQQSLEWWSPWQDQGM